MRSKALAISLVAACLCASAFSQEKPDLVGVVTEPGATTFKVDGTTVLCAQGHTSSALHTTLNPHSQSISKLVCDQRRLGEYVELYGKLNGRKHTLQATSIEAFPVALEQRPVAGLALLEEATPGTDGLWVRADGYRIHLDRKTALEGKDTAAKSLEGVRTNMWLQYEGKLQADGTVTADRASVTPNVVGKREDKLRRKTDFAESTATNDSRQGALSRMFLGADGKRIPMHDDAAMAERVRRIGESLVPAFERKLAKDDPTRIDFSFRLVDEPKYADGVTYPSGIILVPCQTVERLNDDQLAALLAGNISVVIQRQIIHFEAAVAVHGWVNLAGSAAGLFLPGAGIATNVVTGTKEHNMLRAQNEQAMRSSLFLLQDAGYNLREAPTSWWIIDTRPGKDVIDHPMPDSSRYLYGLLATTWRQTVQSAGATPQTGS